MPEGLPDETQRQPAAPPDIVPPEMVQDAPASLGGEARDVAVLFSDLRGFTTYSADAAPGALIAELNGYFETMVSVIRAQSRRAARSLAIT